MEYNTIRMVAKLMNYGGAILLFVTSIMKFLTFNFMKTEFILNLYYILFGLIIFAVELGIRPVLTQFYFMNFSFGKALFAGFVGSITFTISYWLQTVLSSFFFAACLFFFILGCVCHKAESEDLSKRIPSGAQKPPSEQEMKPQDQRIPAAQA